LFKNMHNEIHSIHELSMDMEALNDLPTTKGILHQATKWTLEAQVGCYTQQRA